MTFKALALLAACGLALAQDRPPEFQFRELATDAETLPYVVYAPKNLEPDKSYPFVVFLHGSCEVCVTHERILKESNLRMWHGYDRNEQREPTFLVAPAGGRGGWTSRERTAALFEIIDALIEEFPIDRRRIYLQGFSMGGYGTWHLLQQRPGFFAAANPQAAGGGTVDPEKVRRTPIWATIGALDRPQFRDQLTANVSRVRRANGDPRGPLTHVAGVNPRFSVFADTNHGGAQAKTQELPGFLDWFYAQVNDGNTAPNVWFTQPFDGAEYFSSTLEVRTEAEDADTEVVKVEFFLDGEPVGIDQAAPFEHVLSDLQPGAHEIEARAVDSGGKSRTATVEITVR